MVLAASGLVEAALWMPALWKYKRLYANFLLLALAIITGLIFNRLPAGWLILIAVTSIYRAVNLNRVIEGRMHPEYLKRVTRKTSCSLVLLQLVFCLLAIISSQLLWNWNFWSRGLSAISLAGALVVLYSTIRNVSRMRTTRDIAPLADRDMPTLSVCIPARNETEDLENCLRSLIKSSYQKLEILVVDDCSQDKRTSEIIRGYAHDGVRFISGETPNDSWLAKNYAYEQLSRQANGNLLLFCGVDTLFSPDTIKLLVETMMLKKTSMISIMPANVLNAHNSKAAVVLQTVRYAWELCLPRRFFKRPPVLSTCWMIRRQAFDDAGGFRAVSRSVSPERYFARSCVANNSGYEFISSGEKIGLASNKNLTELGSTAIRTRYPQLHRRPEMIMLASLIETALLVSPYFLLITFLLSGKYFLAGLSLVDTILLVISYRLVTRLAYRLTGLQSFYLQPIASMYDIYLLNRSMWLYEFDEVVWKGRNVCLPVMHVTPSLPDLNKPT